MSLSSLASPHVYGRFALRALPGYTSLPCGVSFEIVVNFCLRLLFAVCGRIFCSKLFAASILKLAVCVGCRRFLLRIGFDTVLSY